MGSSQPEGNKIQFNGGSWIPVTPHKPIIPKPPQSPLIYAEVQVARNQQQANWFGSERLSFDSTREGEASSGVACYDAGANSGYNWEAVPAEQFNGTATGEWYSIDRADKWNLPFMQLLALASDRFNSGSSSQFGLESSSVNRSYVSETVEYEISHPYQHAFDLNFPSGAESDAASFRIASQFEPATPDKGKSRDAQTVSELRELPTEKNRDQKEQNSECNTSISINGENPRENKEVPVPEASSTITATFTPNEKEGKHDVNLNKTPPSRQRRKKHRPKVIVEGKSKRTPKSPGSNPSKGKRRVRKNGLSKPSATPTIEISSESSDQEQEVLKPRRKSCRRVLHFHSQAQTRDEPSLCRSSDSGPLEHDSHSQNINSSTEHEEVRLEQVVSSIEPTWSRNQVQKSYNSLLEKQAPSAQIPELRLPSDHQMKTNIEQNDRIITSFEKGNMIEIVLNNDTELFAGRPNGFNIGTNPTLTYSEQVTYSKRKHSDDIKLADTGSINLTGVHYNTLYAYQSMPWIHFPNICKRKRTEKGQGPTTSSAFTSETARHFTSPEKTCSFNDPEINHVVSNSNNCIAEPNGGKKHQDKLQTYRNIMAFGQSKSVTKKRSRSNKQAGCESRPIYPTNQPPVDSSINNVDRSRVCINALLENMHATVAKKKRTRKKFPTNSALSDTNKVSWLCGFIPSNSYQFFPRTIGATSEEHGNQECYSDAIVERLKHLGSNEENNHLSYTEQALIPYGYNMQNQEHNAIVIYGQDGTMVPFTPMKKRRPRPKVELDEETNKVWKLLLENINSEGINGTEEEKIKWWEEERKVFRGRADSFIARMHLVQGDRRFSKWKGSVVDSVVGVFLTQNVSDHLSSSAFMSLAARFPPKPKCQQACYQEVSIELDEPEAYMLNSEDDMKFNKQIMHQSISEQSSLMKPERSGQQKTVDANESSGSNEERNSNKEPELKVLNTSRNILETCSQSVGETSFIGTRALQPHCSRETRTYDSFRFQDCLDSSASQTSERIEPCIEGNSEDLPSCSKKEQIDYSSKILIQMAGLNINAQDTEVSFIDQSKTAKREIEDTFQPDDREISIEDSANRLSSNQIQLAQTSELLDVDCYQIYDEFQTSSALQNKDEQFKTEFTQTVESDTRANMEAVEVEIHEAPLSSSELSINIKENSLALQSQGSVIEDPRIVESPTECTINLHENPSFFSSNTTGIETQSNPKDCDHSLGKEIKEMKTATSKPQRKRVGKGKEGEINWDHLRKQTATNGKTRQKTENTMDSLDWEAIRCADVHEIAHTIRERGMNNMLAERIKDFLNRLVRDHGSIDLEWLRDVEPDRAKEYLLSFRGLGLKSVECVRLLTLHHLAFPVDTNVGRIAVRLGWVPLQPLPESLQLHLLEMYPVLESIQKYLWPRLCKLDQRTLYELHYQMITFGKVFCTKSKPNCNACPMRGECRHFASAFASARLGLPAPEDKRIVSTTESREPDEKPDRIIDQQLLPAPPSSKVSEEIKSSESSHHQSDKNMGINNCIPIIEEPTTPEQESMESSIRDIEDAFYEDPDEIPTIKLNIEEFSHNLQNYMEKNMELQEGDVSKALIALTPEAASIPVPKLKNVSRLRTEHQVYELPDSHPLLEKLQMDRREPDDPSSYLLAIWTPGETANSIQLPEKRCSYQECGQLCNEEECFSCNSIREANSQMVRGTLLIPCRTAMRGSFPLNGTYFQVNEVFADHDSSLNPIEVPRNWIWNLPRRTVYFGTSIPTIFKGLSTQGIQHCFWRGFVCVRGFDHKSRAPRPLMARLHFPASKLNRGRGGKTEDQ